MIFTNDAEREGKTIASFQNRGGKITIAWSAKDVSSGILYISHLYMYFT
jgi:hypothetical protein